MSWKAAQTSSQWSRSAGSTSSSAATITCARSGHEVEQLAEVADGQQLGDVRALVGVLQRRDLGQLAVLGRELGGGRDLDRVGVAERALGEGREPAQRLDLVVEEVDADGALLRRRVDVQQPAADGELAALLDLVDALVARRDEVGGGLVEVEQLADPQREAVRAQLRVGHLLAQRHGGDHDDRLLGALGRVEQRVERRDPQADEVRRRRQVRLVGDAAARVEAHGPRAQPGAQVGGEVARGAVVAGHHDRRAAHVAVGQRGQQERPQRLRDERRAALVGEPRGGRIVLEMGEEGAERHGGPGTPNGRASCAAVGALPILGLARDEPDRRGLYEAPSVARCPPACPDLQIRATHLVQLVDQLDRLQLERETSTPSLFVELQLDRLQLERAKSRPSARSRPCSTTSGSRTSGCSRCRRWRR